MKSLNPLDLPEILKLIGI